MEEVCLLNIFPSIANVKICKLFPEEEKKKNMVDLCLAWLPGCTKDNQDRKLTICDFCTLFLQLSHLRQSAKSSSSETLLDTSEKSPLQVALTLHGFTLHDPHFTQGLYFCQMDSHYVMHYTISSLYTVKNFV